MPEFATTISNILSLLKSLIATEYGRDRVPVEYTAAAPKVPLPKPSRIATLSVSELVTTMSKLWSLLKSSTATEYGAELFPVENTI